MYYVYEFLKRKWPYPESIVDWSLKLQHKNGLWDSNVPYCIDLDGIFSMIRSSRNANWYRWDDIKKFVEKYLKTTEIALNSEKFVFENYTNTHKLTGAFNTIAECQKNFPDLVQTSRPWNQSLDKACYI